MRFRRLLCLAFVVPVLVAGSVASAQDKDVSSGRQLFLHYCASCHGVSGAGDGPVAKGLTKPPANLRLLADRYGSPLPAQTLAALIDGRNAVRAHGTHDMPVWGERLYATDEGNNGEPGISETLRKIAAYLSTIQDRKTARR
jgi:mono/diheme cytochrome c family protein